MKSKAISGIMLTLLLTCMLTLAFNIQPAKASGTIYIMADGSVEGTTDISSADNVTYIFTGNIYDMIYVQRDNIVVDGAGYRVQGTGSGTGIYLSHRNNITLKNVEVTNFLVGIYLVGSNNNALICNNASSNLRVSYLNGFGIHLDYSNNNVLTNNTASSNENVGIWLTSSRNNTLSGNTVFSNYNYGIGLSSSNNNTLTGNIASDNREGVVLYESVNNVLTNNTISSNNNGIRFQSPNNVIFHNNLVNNTSQASKSTNLDVPNRWDNGYPSGGNYWSDYNGTDLCSGPHQNETGSDGIGDTPYDASEGNQDNYPLMSPWPPPEHELVTSVKAPASLLLGSSSSLNATVTNQGSNNETSVELLLLINGTLIDSTTIPLLQGGSSHTLSYLWIPPVEGTYNVTAHVPSLPEEGNKENNQATKFVTVIVTQPPVASFTYSPTTPIEGETMTFDASASYDPDGSIVSYEWDFGEGAIDSGEIVTHAYTDAGTYIVTLTVTDNKDVTDTDTSSLTISPAPTYPVGVEAGDWIKCKYSVSGAPSGTTLPQWIKLEFLSVDKTTATVRVTMHMSDGTEQSDTVPVDVVAGEGALGLSGFVVPANCTTGDSICISGYGNVTIAGETTRTCAGAKRTVVYASFSQYGTELTYYWDKETGVMVEASTTSGVMTGTAKATETNMWQATPSGLPVEPTYLYILAMVIIVVAAATGVFLMRRKKTREKRATQPDTAPATAT